MNLFNFFKQNSENRTQFFIVMGFIILPVLAMVYVFVAIVMEQPDVSSERLRVPAHLLENASPDQK